MSGNEYDANRSNKRSEEEIVALEGLKARTGGLLAHMQPATGAWFKQGGNR